MEKINSAADTVLLLDNYNEESAMLHQSMKKAGFSGPVIVIEDDGFFPEDVISAYQYFCGTFKNKEGIPGKPRYFNQIQVPDYWEISANNSSGKVKDFYRERGRIFYAEPKHKRLVRVVDWLDERGVVRSSDHYNRYGVLYARTFFNKDGKKFCKAYFDAEGREVLLENYVTHNIIVNRNEKVYVLKNKTELVLKVLEELGVMQSRIFYNSLSTPLFVSERMPSERKEDILFWQEPVRNDIPGNMQAILHGTSNRTKKIYVQKRESYLKFLELGVPSEVVDCLGFVYDYEGENSYKNEALICTNSDRIEKCEELIQALPNLHFHIAAITEMSSKLMSLARYENVSLYPGVRMDVLEDLFHSCDYYLDINHESEIVSAVKKAFDHQMLIAGFKQTLHNKAFIAPEHVFEDFNGLKSFLESVMNDVEKIDRHLEVQKKIAMSESLKTYANLL